MTRRRGKNSYRDFSHCYNLLCKYFIYTKIIIELLMLCVIIHGVGRGREKFI